MNNAPNGYEVCTVEECTHALLAGETEPREVVIHPCRNSFVIVALTDVSVDLWQPLGITPLRKVEVKPIVFEATPYKIKSGHVAIDIPQKLYGKHLKVTVEVLD